MKSRRQRKDRLVADRLRNLINSRLRESAANSFDRPVRTDSSSWWTKKFRGQIRFSRRRTRWQTVRQILEICLHRPPFTETARTQIDRFLSEHLVKSDALEIMCHVDWSVDDYACEHVLALLQRAGYCGTKVDLWHSVCGCEPPHTMTAGTKSGRTPLSPRWIVNSGQTKKPGSHSNR